VVDTSAPIRDEIEQFAKAMRQEKKRHRQAMQLAEARGRIAASLIMLSRYEPRYESVLAFLEDQWQNI